MVVVLQAILLWNLHVSPLGSAAKTLYIGKMSGKNIHTLNGFILWLRAPYFYRFFLVRLEPFQLMCLLIQTIQRNLCLVQTETISFTSFPHFLYSSIHYMAICSFLIFVFELRLSWLVREPWFEPYAAIAFSRLLFLYIIMNSIYHSLMTLAVEFVRLLLSKSHSGLL